MDRHGYAVCTPRVNDPDIGEEAVIDFTSVRQARAAHASASGIEDPGACTRTT